MKSFRSKCYDWSLALFEDNYGNDDSYCDIFLAIFEIPHNISQANLL